MTNNPKELQAAVETLANEVETLEERNSGLVTAMRSVQDDLRSPIRNLRLGLRGVPSKDELLSLYERITSTLAAAESASTPRRERAPRRTSTDSAVPKSVSNGHDQPAQF